MYKIDTKKSLFTFIKNSLGTELFKSVYFFINKKSIDIYKKEELNCSLYLRTILKIIDVYSIARKVIKDIGKSVWCKIDNFQKDEIIIWNKEKLDHLHIGFYLGNNKAVSHSFGKRMLIVNLANYQGRKNFSHLFS